MKDKIIFRRIDTISLCRLLKYIEIINYWIKRKETMISKSNFYNIKKHLLNYIMLCCDDGVYRDDEVSYVLNNIEIHKDKNGKSYPNKLVSMTLNVRGMIFKFHRILDNTLKSLIDKEKLKQLEEVDYKDNTEVFEELSAEELHIKYRTIINILAEEFDWCIYRYIDDYNWIKLIQSRYQIYKLIPEWNYYKGINPKNKIIRIKLNKNQKYVNQMQLDFNNFKLTPHSTLKRRLPKEFFHLNIF